MKNSIELLMEEHRLIEKGLDALEAFSNQVKSQTTEDEKGDLGKLVEFIREFADRTHHGKEEDILFKIMVENGFPKEAGPIAVMLHEHDEGRGYVKSMDQYAQKGEAWTPDDRTEIALAGKSFVTLLRQHIQKEDNILYPMAQQRLPEDVMQNIHAQCDAFETQEKQSGENSRLRELGGELHARFCK